MLLNICLCLVNTTILAYFKSILSVVFAFILLFFFIGKDLAIDRMSQIRFENAPRYPVEIEF